MALTRKYSPHHTIHLLNRNFSSRLGAPIQAIALHSTESWDKKGWDDLHGVRSWFSNSQAQASSHLGIDGEGHVEKWVRDANKAWTILQLNPVTLNIEFVGRAAQPKSEWEKRQIDAGAQWAAYWGIRHDIPTRRGEVKNINGFPVITRKGIITHHDLTKAGFGSHTDPGPNFPINRFIELAREYREKGWPKFEAGHH
jgi:N-acetyl-anhydromuramyl-L-alanine amidase AmpD